MLNHLNLPAWFIVRWLGFPDENNILQLAQFPLQFLHGLGTRLLIWMIPSIFFLYRFQHGYPQFGDRSVSLHMWWAHGEDSTTKGGESYIRAMPSKLKSTAAEKTAKRALAFVEKEVGGIMTAHSASALPHGRQQVDDIRRGALSEVDTDFLYICNDGNVQRKWRQKMYLGHLFDAAPFPMMVLAFDWTLDDLIWCKWILRLGGWSNL